LTENSLLEIEEFIGFMGLLRTTKDTLDLAAGLELIFDKYIKLPNDTSEHLEKRLIKSALLETANWFRRDIRGFVQFVTTQEYESDGFSAPPGINFLTFAAAKGYEFPVVFIIGAEEGITPVTSAESDMEEERRLFYLAMTRAKEKLFISSAAKREMSGRILKLLPSRFLHDLPETATDILVVQKKTKKLLYEQLPLF
jgi:superfamily I DNA/RNA helicase